MRSTVFFGNGLGMAINTNHFRLSSGIDYAIREALDRSEEQEIDAIKSCIFQGCSEDTIRENDLGRMHDVSDACAVVRGATPTSNKFLTAVGDRFHKAVDSFNLRVAYHFFKFEEECEEFDSFYASLREFLKQTKSHVATLNYDSLLYKKMVDDGTLAGYSGTLIDGFTRNGGEHLIFKDSNLDRHSPRQLGFYLHLHGSPLFHSVSQGIAKHSIPDVLNESEERHLVLTHINKKMGVIGNSPVLKGYWSRFIEAILETDQLIVVGYGGGDLHINQLIQLGFKRRGRIRVVERTEEGSFEERLAFWKSRFGESVGLVQIESILNFRDWA